MKTKRLTGKQLRVLVESVVEEASPASDGSDAVTFDDIEATLKQAQMWANKLSMRRRKSLNGGDYVVLLDRIDDALRVVNVIRRRGGL